jgi:hypothetical protein
MLPRRAPCLAALTTQFTAKAGFNFIIETLSPSSPARGCHALATCLNS